MMGEIDRTGFAVAGLTYQHREEVRIDLLRAKRKPHLAGQRGGDDRQDRTEEVAVRAFLESPGIFEVIGKDGALREDRPVDVRTQGICRRYRSFPARDGDSTLEICRTDLETRIRGIRRWRR